MNLFLFFGIFFISYLLFRNLNFSGYKEGMTTTDNNTTSTGSPPLTGIAGNAASYGATIKQNNIKLQDQLLISKYRSDYEAVILDLDEALDITMLGAALSMPLNNQQRMKEKIKELAELNMAKGALNNVMKFIDKK